MPVTRRQLSLVNIYGEQTENRTGELLIGATACIPSLCPFNESGLLKICRFNQFPSCFEFYGQRFSLLTFFYFNRVFFRKYSPCRNLISQRVRSFLETKELFSQNLAKCSSFSLFLPPCHRGVTRSVMKTRGKTLVSCTHARESTCNHRPRVPALFFQFQV